MFQNIDLFSQSAALSRHAGQQQAQIARNIANADTPSYQARHLAAFSPDTGTQWQVSRRGHMALPAPQDDSGGVTSPNGNSVSLESEIFASVAAQRSHASALAIYRHAMTVIRTSVKG